MIAYNRYRKKEEPEMISDNIKRALCQIWGSETYHVILLLTTDGQLYAECEETMDRRRITESNYVEILNDMFYNFCMEKASWMGVS
jgi:hypothetical protein